ncbi:MAG: hypothetical protein K2Q17_02465, partial [Nitrospiraceae bacterium]|nr:hypothetical protein [Nitrospiraceae bacterium]
MILSLSQAAAHTSFDTGVARPEQAFGSGEQETHASWEEGESRHHVPPALPAEATRPLPRYGKRDDGLHDSVLRNERISRPLDRQMLADHIGVELIAFAGGHDG